MTALERLRRTLSSITKTSRYTGRFLFFAIRVGFVKTTMMYILVRKYQISLEIYSKITKEIKIINSVSLGLYLFKDKFSYDEVKKAVRSLDSESDSDIRREFEDELLGKFDN